MNQYVLTLFIFIMLLTGSGAAADWTMDGGGPERTGQGDQTLRISDDHVRSWDARPALVWAQDVSSPVGSPLVVDDKVIVTSRDSGVFAFNLFTGALAWHLPLAPIATSAVAGDGLVFVASVYGMIFGLNQHNGQIEWYFDVNNFDGEEDSMLMDAPLLYSAGRLFVGISKTERVIALDTSNGVLAWIGNSWLTPHGDMISRGSQVFIPLHNGSVVQMDANNGEILGSVWLEDGHDSRGGATWGGNAVVSVCSYDALCATKPWAGEMVWKQRFKDQGAITSAAVSDGHVYAASSSYVFSLDIATGSELWRTSANMLPGVPDARGVVIGNQFITVAGSVAGFERETGEIQWVSSPPPPRECDSASANGPPAAAGHLLIVVAQGSSCKTPVWPGVVYAIDLHNMEVVREKEISNPIILAIFAIALCVSTRNIRIGVPERLRDLKQVPP